MSRSRVALALALSAVLAGLAAFSVAQTPGAPQEAPPAPAPAVTPAVPAKPPMSRATSDCIACHTSVHPGIVAAWEKSRHAKTTLAEAMRKTGLAKTITAANPPQEMREVSVGCAECHTVRDGEHPDSFEHAGYKVHTVVSPRDCAVCHSEETEQYGRNLMSQARQLFINNPVYLDMAFNHNAVQVYQGGKIEQRPPNEKTDAESCYYCHGTEVKVIGTQVKDTDFGEMEIPTLSGWPNQGTGRFNPDGSRGSCSACHTRHEFSIAMARKPDTCSECHIGPDVPANKVYSSSKHGNIYASLHKSDGWNFTNIPWTIGRDFTAPTCAVCHMSQLVDTDGKEVVKRSHEVADRLPWRIFGLIYAHPHPRDADTSKIRNSSGNALPTDFDGSFASEEFLLKPAEMAERQARMQASCRKCHTDNWTDGHWLRMENAIAATNETTLAATRIMQDIWAKGYANGPDRGDSIFNESIERRWSDFWLFYGNTIRFASAMAGGGDYGVFADGRYHFTKGVMDLYSWMETRDLIAAQKTVGGRPPEKKTPEGQKKGR